MNALRIRTQALRSARQYLVASRLYASSSNPVPENTPHTPDTYQKDEDSVAPPTSSKTHVVSEHDGEGTRTQRPFEPPTGSYTTVDSSKPYDSPAKNAQEEQSKLKYGGTERGMKDVDGHGNPQGSGKEGRR